MNSQSIDLLNLSVFDDEYVKILYKTKSTLFGRRRRPSGYQVTKSFRYYSKRYDKWVHVDLGDHSDGATYAKDIDSFGWLVHDDLKRVKLFEDGTVCTNLQASFILYDILLEEGYWFRARSWYSTTLLWGTIVN